MLKRLISTASRSQRSTKNCSKWEQTFMKQQSIRYHQTKQRNPLTNARCWNIFWWILANNEETQQQNRSKTRKRDKHHGQNNFSFDCYILKYLVSRASLSRQITKNCMKWQQTFMKQYLIRYNQTKQHIPGTNARFCDIFWQIKTNNQETQEQNTRTTTKMHKHRGQKCLFIRLLYFQTPYFQTLPESTKHKNLYQMTTNPYKTVANSS